MESLLRFEDKDDTLVEHSPSGQSSGVKPGMKLGRFASGKWAKKRENQGSRGKIAKEEETTANQQFTRENLEARIGVEPMNKGFADLGLTTWLPRRLTEKVSLHHIAPKPPKSITTDIRRPNMDLHQVQNVFPASFAMKKEDDATPVRNPHSLLRSDAGLCSHTPLGSFFAFAPWTAEACACAFIPLQSLVRPLAEFIQLRQSSMPTQSTTDRHLRTASRSIRRPNTRIGFVPSAAAQHLPCTILHNGAQPPATRVIQSTTPYSHTLYSRLN